MPKTKLRPNEKFYGENLSIPSTLPVNNNSSEDHYANDRRRTRELVEGLK
jgi:hypothetical protein